MIYEKQTIYGQPPSKSNQYRIITLNGHGSLAKTQNTKEYEQNFYKQCSLRDKKIKGFFKLDIDVYFKSNQPDVDNAIKVVLDCLQSCKAILNDRNCMEIHARKLIDKERPRIEFAIEEVGV